MRHWNLVSSSPPKFDYSITTHGQSFINTVAYLPSSAEFPEGLILSGGQDSIIEARQPSRAGSDNADALLLGHEGNVCSLDVCPEGNWVVSGSWDCSARVWQVGRWERSIELEGHQGSVWAVLAFDKDTVITGMTFRREMSGEMLTEAGSADKGIRIFTSSGKLLRNVRGSKDVVRALCKVPSGHASGAQFASAGNDGIIRLWTLDGSQVGELHGHESFIYSLDSLPSGELVSSGEDRTARIWRGAECVQTITHPAISVWSVAVCQQTGDIVTGASDRIARVFSRSTERYAEASVIQNFDEAVKGSSIPQEQVGGGGGINKEKLPGPDFLTSKSGTKEGQVQMIKEANGNVTAYQWSVGQSTWIAIGTVVDSAGSSGRKTEYLGQDYDYVFDVDIKDGEPPLKLPYNLSQNPYEAATKFLHDNELPLTYLDQVANFITTNTQGASLGQAQSSAPAPAGADPWGQESRYRPGDAAQQSTPSAPPSRPKVLPQKEYLFITTANLKTIHKKICELNDQLVSSGQKDLSFSPSDLDLLSSVCEQLSQNTTGPFDDTPRTRLSVKMALKIATAWPSTHRLPGYDLLRLLATKVDSLASSNLEGYNADLISIFDATQVFSPDSNPNIAMLATRAFANLFATESGQSLISTRAAKILSLLETATSNTNTNRNLSIAATTFYINLAVFLLKSSSEEDYALDLLGALDRTLRQATDSEVIYRALVALGTIVNSPSEDVKLAAVEIHGFKDVLGGIEAKAVGKEPRIKSIVEEIRGLL